MYALMITVSTSMTKEELARKSDTIAEDMFEVEGLVLKTWMHYGSKLGGFHLFTDQRSAEKFKEGPIVQQKAKGMGSVHIEEYEVFDGPSQRNGTPAEPLRRHAYS